MDGDNVLPFRPKSVGPEVTTEEPNEKSNNNAPEEFSEGADLKDFVPAALQRGYGVVCIAYDSDTEILYTSTSESSYATVIGILEHAKYAYLQNSQYFSSDKPELPAPDGNDFNGEE